MFDLASLFEQAGYFAGPEGVAVVCAILYLLLAIRQNIWCWLFAGVSTAISVYVFFTARLYMEAVLNVFYFAMAIYGWYSWQNPGQNKRLELPVVVWSGNTHALAILVIAVASAVSGFLLDWLTDAVYPYVDSATSWASVWATFLVARKVLENWWYWLVIDAASIVIFWSRDLELMAILFALYVIMIPFGLVSWRRSMRADEIL